MTTLIKLRRSAVPGKTPADAQLELGEVAINTYDGKMFFKRQSTSNAILEVATTSNHLGQFASTTSAQLASIITNETGSGSLVFGTSPTLVSPTINSNTTFDSGTLFVDSVNNRVGVNTTSPTQALHVVGNARITGGIADSNGNFGTPGQVLASNTTGTYWMTSAASGTDLSTTYANDAVTVNSSTGTNALIIAANGINAGVLSAPDKVKLDGIEAGAQVNVPTNLSIGSSTGTVVRIDSSTGTNATLPVASATLAGVITNAAQTFAGAKTFNNDVIIADKIVHSGDTNTTIRFPAADTVTIETSGSERLRVDSTGNVGIGTTDPKEALHVRGELVLGDNNFLSSNLYFSDGWKFVGSSGYAGFIKIASSSNDFEISVTSAASTAADSVATVHRAAAYEMDNKAWRLYTDNSERLRISSSGNVGIGITSPDQKLDVSGNIRSSNQFISTVATGTAPLSVDSTTLVSNLNADLLDGVQGSGYVNVANTQTISGQKTFTSNPVISGTAPVLEFYESDQAADNQRWFARSEGSNFTIQAVTDAGSGGGNLWRFTRSGNQVTALEGTVSGSSAISLTNASRSLTFTGGTGTIGTTDAQRLQLNTNGTTKVTINSSGNVGIGTTASDSVPGFNRFIAIGDSDTGIGQISDGILAFATNNSEKMRITGGGNVGIGTTSPQNKLDIYGSGTPLRFTGTASNATGGVEFFNSIGRVAEINVDGGSGQITFDSDPLNQYTSSHIIFKTDGNARMRVNSDGNVGINETDPTTRLHISEDAVPNSGSVVPLISLELFDADETENVAAGTGPAIDFYVPDSTGSRLSRSQVSGRIACIRTSSSDVVGDGALVFSTAINAASLVEQFRIAASGEATFTQEVTAPNFNTTSDRAIKENVEVIDNALDKVLTLTGYTFNYIAKPDKKQAGVIAQEVEEVLPEVVDEREDGIKTVAYGNMVALLIEAIKEQQKQIDELKALVNK